jgi:hypothetical protein
MVHSADHAWNKLAVCGPDVRYLISRSARAAAGIMKVYQSAVHESAMSRYAREDLIGLAIFAVVALALLLLFRGFGRWSSKPPVPPPRMREGGYPRDAVAKCVYTPLPPRWVAFIGPDYGSVHGFKYWLCPDNHASKEDALGCAGNQLAYGTWDQRSFI